MSVTLGNIEIEDVYEAPLLAEVGEYAEETQGTPAGFRPEGTSLFYFL